MDGLIKRWFETLEQAIPDYKVNARGSKPDSGVISKAFLIKNLTQKLWFMKLATTLPVILLS